MINKTIAALGSKKVVKLVCLAQNMEYANLS